MAAVYEHDIVFNQGDLDATLSFYEDLALKGTATQLKTHVKDW